jgi:hypothetical protein
VAAPRTLRALAVAALAFIVLLVGGSGPAEAADGATPLPADAPAKAIELMRAGRRIEVVDRRDAVLQQRLVSVNTALQMVESQLQANEQSIEQVKQRIRVGAAAAYAHSSTSSEAPLQIDHVADLSAAQHYVQSALDVDAVALDDLQQIEDQLRQQRDGHAAERDQLQGEHQQFVEERARLVQTQAGDDATLQHEGAVPVMGRSWLTPAQLAAWYRSTGAVPRLASGATIDDLTRLYVIEGNAEGVRGDLAFAQAVIETGSFGVAAGNNYSGIGVCDSCTGGYAFPTPLDGVRTQIQLLKNYADPDSRAATLANPPSPALYGAEPRKAAATYDAFFLKGKAPLWNEMGGGNWATDPTYAGKVLSLYARMVAFVSGASP